jgi:hypothetical protein
LRGYVEAMGGSLSLIAEFRNRVPVVLAGVGDSEPAPMRTRGRKRAKVLA